MAYYPQITEQQGNEMLLFLSTSTPPPPTWWFWPTTGWDTIPSLTGLTTNGIKLRQNELRSSLIKKGHLVRDGWRYCWHDPNVMGQWIMTQMETLPPEDRIRWLMKQIETLPEFYRLALFAQIGATYGQIHK